MTSIINLIFQFVSLYVACSVAHVYSAKYGFLVGSGLWLLTAIWAIAAEVDKNKALKEARK